MNRFENWFCSSSFWRGVTRRHLLPWLLEDTELGDHVLEIGAGAGAATEELRMRAPRVTSLEYSRHLLEKLVQRNHRRPGALSANASAVRGDASSLPFRNKTFSAVCAVLMLHHLKSSSAQDAALAEAFRVLRPGGLFVAMDIPDGWLHRVAHFRSTFVPLDPALVPGRFAAAGFSSVTLDFRGGAFRVRALRARQAGEG